MLLVQQHLYNAPTQVLVQLTNQSRDCGNQEKGSGPFLLTIAGVFAGITKYKMSDDLNQPEYLSDTDPEKNYDYMRQDHGGTVTTHNGVADAVAERCRLYRAAAEAGEPDPLAPIMPDGKLGYKWMDLPNVVSIRISDQYFGGMPWAAIKNDRTLKAQFYRVVQQEYPQYVCYPGGQLPIPVAVPYPAKAGQQKFFKGHKL